ncbi:alanine racemase [Clostridium uliginosum]|uniref:Alanine racemase n=1 Tax=Clostridium uliginosum TaxID=119641 RepID=A0A1I1QH83_9CLOT|nr:alanine racemase [Clostridium uliginosum]
MAPIIGKICMNQYMVDVSSIDGVKVDNVLIGEENESKFTADEMAKSLNAISYKVFCISGKRAPKIYINKRKK